MTLLDHSIMQLTGPDGTAEFNVDPDETMFKLTIGGKERRFKKVDLWALVFAISAPEEQAKMIPVRQTEMVTYRRVHTIKLKRDLPQGALVKCHCEINVPQTVVEGLNGMVEQQKRAALAPPGAPSPLPIIGQRG